MHAAELDTEYRQTLLAAVWEAAPDAVFIVDAEGVIVLANRMAERMFGYERAELIGQSIELLVPPAARGAHSQHRERYERAPRTREMGSSNELQGTRKNGDAVPVEISLSPLDTPRGRVTIAICRDVTRRRQLEQQLRFASTHDALTDLFNRAYLDSIRPGLEGSQGPVGVLIVDVDGLKQVNDRLGHAAGDKILRRCGVVLRSSAQPDAVVARLGGDEFAIVIPNATQQILDQTMARIQEDLLRHNEVTRGPKLQMSIGCALSERRGGIGQAMRVADQRMYENKSRRRGNVR